MWDLEKDRIFFVLNAKSITPSTEHYITGEYSEDNNSVILFADKVTIPINIDYFIKLWNSSFPDNIITREQTFVKNAGVIMNNKSSGYLPEEQWKRLNEEEVFSLVKKFADENIQSGPQKDQWIDQNMDEWEERGYPSLEINNRTAYNKKELNKGIKEEKEHSDTLEQFGVKDEKIFNEIAKDHLEEIPDYYSRLQKLKKDIKGKKGKQ